MFLVQAKYVVKKGFFSYVLSISRGAGKSTDRTRVFRGPKFFSVIEITFVEFIRWRMLQWFFTRNFWLISKTMLTRRKECRVHFRCTINGLLMFINADNYSLNHDVTRVILFYTPRARFLLTEYKMYASWVFKEHSKNILLPKCFAFCRALKSRYIVCKIVRCIHCIKKMAKLEYNSTSKKENFCVP